MPTYSVRNKQTGEVKEMFCSISEMEIYKIDHPEEEILCGTPLLHSGRGLQKPDSGFRDVLKRIKKASGRNNNINTF